MGFKYTRLDGKLNMHQKSEVCEKFQNTKDVDSPNVLLLSLRAGKINLIFNIVWNTKKFQTSINLKVLSSLNFRAVYDVIKKIEVIKFIEVCNFSQKVLKKICLWLVLYFNIFLGGVGLNLTAANHLLLLDPAWNPSTENQCFDRIHRLGQTKDVNIIKFIMRDR